MRIALYFDTNMFSLADTHFWIGTGDGPSKIGEAIPDESGSLAPLGRYTNQVRIIMYFRWST